MQARQVLHKLLQTVCSEMHKLRRTALFVNVMAALHGEVLTVTRLGRSITSGAKEKHCIKRADRLLSNPHLQGCQYRSSFPQKCRSKIPPPCCG
jgi:hypothetical protein